MFGQRRPLNLPGQQKKKKDQGRARKITNRLGRITASKIQYTIKIKNLVRNCSWKMNEGSFSNTPAWNEVLYLQVWRGWYELCIVMTVYFSHRVSSLTDKHWSFISFWRNFFLWCKTPQFGTITMPKRYFSLLTISAVSRYYFQEGQLFHFISLRYIGWLRPLRF